MPKRTVLDPRGQTIQHALSSLGLRADFRRTPGQILRSQSGWWSRDEAQQQLERISKEVLANPVIEEYRFEIVE